MIVTVPLPPSTNNAYVNLSGKGRVLTGVARTYKREVQAILMAQHLEAPDPPYSLCLWLLFPNAVRRDASNHIKLLEDAISDYFGYDDRGHHELHVYKAIDRHHPRAVVVLSQKYAPVPSPPDRTVKEPGFASV